MINVAFNKINKGNINYSKKEPKSIIINLHSTSKIFNGSRKWEIKIWWNKSGGVGKKKGKKEKTGTDWNSCEKGPILWGVRTCVAFLLDLWNRRSSPPTPSSLSVKSLAIWVRSAHMLLASPSFFHPLHITCKTLPCLEFLASTPTCQTI